MRELFDITPHPTGSGFRMRLKTGEIDVPDGCGGYIISSGMGSGKTESIKSLIRQKYDEGILYCVDTRDELKKMYRWIIEELVPVTDLKGTDVMMVSSDPEFSYFLDLYKDNPEMLMEKKVILITHVRFFTDLINYFLIYRPQGKVDIFDGDFRTLMTRDDLRRYIVFDETPVQITPFVKFDRSMLGLFTTEDDKGNMVCRSPEGIQRFYNRFLKGSRNDLFSNQSFRINRIKRDVVLGLVPKYYDSWMLSDTDSKEIMFYPVDLCPEGVAISTHVLIFEGAGNILFRGSTRFTLLDTENKYNTITEFRRLDFGLRRRSLDEGKFDRFVERIGKLADRPSLIVCWKDVNDDEGPGRSGYAERFRKLLSAKGVDPRLFTITYYGAADNKSTNSYRDIEQIFLCGDWSLPNTESARIRRAYGTSTDSQNQKDWYFSQLITRIGIRKHIEGEVYTVWYTDDFDERFIDRMDAYFNENRITGKASVSHKDWEKKLDAMDIRSNTKEGIRLLAKYDKDMQNAIVMDQKYIKEVTFDYLEMIGLKRYARERRNYKKLIELLEKLGITLVIK